MSASGDPLAQTAAQREAQLAHAADLFRTLAEGPESSWRPVVLPSQSEVRAGAHSRVNSARSVESDVMARPHGRHHLATSYSSSPGRSNELAQPSLDMHNEPFTISLLNSPSPVAIHKRPHPTKGPDVFRAVVKVPYTGSSPGSKSTPSGNAHLEGFRAALSTSDVRSEWDTLVDSSELIEMPAPDVRVTKTNFRLGWPTSPRDAVTVSRTMLDPHAQKLVDITTSLTAQPDSPAYLRPAPPYVRSHVHLAAWALDLPQPTNGQPVPKDQQFIHITAYWCWTLKGAWLGLPAGGLANHLGSTVSRLVQYVREKADTIPLISDFGHAVDVEHTTFDVSRDTLAVDYAVLPDPPAAEGPALKEHSSETSNSKADSVYAHQNHIDVTPDRMLQLLLSTREGWNVKVRVRGSGHARVQSQAGTEPASSPTTQGRHSSSRHPQWRLVSRYSPHYVGGIEVTILHDSLAFQDDAARVSVQVQRVAASTDVRLNGELIPVWPVNPLNALPLSASSEQQASETQRTGSVRSGRSARSISSDRGRTKGSQTLPLSFVCPNSPSAAADLLAHAQPQGWANSPDPGEKFARVIGLADKLRALSFEGGTLSKAGAQMSNPLSPSISNQGAISNAIDSLIRRNYIYFTSLLQEPDAKWKHVSDSRGVSVTQLDSIDPTLVVYRAEATFVGVGVWDLFATILSPGAQCVWDKTHEASTHLADLADLSSLWHSKTKASWPVSARDSVTVCTSYKSPNSVHIFSFSTEDRGLFPQIPSPDPGVIRTQVDLRGWSVESLSPTTVHVTLLEQSDPKGWTSKSSTPTTMAAAAAGVGEYAIKFGGPPVMTRLLGGKVKDLQYDHSRGTYRLEYELASSSLPDDTPNLECELRCDLESWSPNLDLVIDPPPIEISCLRRHKLSQGGGGLWITIEHVPASLEDDTAKITVRRGPAWGSSRERGVVMVNGANIHVDVDELEDDQLKELFRRKRSRPKHVPLDLTSPKFNGTGGSRAPLPPDSAPLVDTILNGSRSGTPSVADANDQGGDTTSPTDSARTTTCLPPPRSAERDSMTGPLDVLFLLRRLYAERSPDPSVTPAGWALVSERNGLHVRRKYLHSISSTVAVQRADKVVQGLAAEEILQAVESLAVRKKIQERVDTIIPLQSYGHGAGVHFSMTKPSFPFRGRAFCTAHITARTASAAQVKHLARVQQSTHRYPDQIPLEPLPLDGALGTSDVAGSNPGKPIAYFYAAASCSWESVTRTSGLPSTKEGNSAEHAFGGRLNTAGLPVGRVLIDGWILETVDPYTSTSHAIPSTRLTHVMAIDFGGSVPSSVNTSWNAALPKTINLIETYLKGSSPSVSVGPSVDIPPSNVLVVGDGRDEDPDLPWSLTLPAGAETRTLLHQDFDPLSKKFEAHALLHIPSLSPASASASGAWDHKQSSTMRLPQRRGTRPDRRALSFSSFKEDVDTSWSTMDKPLESPAQRPKSTLLPSPSTDYALATQPGSTPPRNDSPLKPLEPNSHSSLSNAVGETRRPVSLSKQAGEKRPREDVCMEITIELGHYPRGYKIEAEAIRVPLQRSVAPSSLKQPGAEFKASLTRASSVALSLTDADVSITNAADAEADQDDGTAGATTPRPESSLRDRKTPEPSSSVPLDLDADWSHSSRIPLEAAVYDLPPSALLAATLDSQSRPRRHLVRLYLSSDETVSDTAKPEEAEWADVLLTCTIIPRSPRSGDTLTFAQLDEDSDRDISLASGKDESDPTAQHEELQSLVRFNDVPMEVVHVNKTSALLQRESPDADAVPILCKLSEVSDAPTDPEEKSYVPTLYNVPLAAHMNLISVPEPTEDKNKPNVQEGKEAVSKPSTHEFTKENEGENPSKPGEDSEKGASLSPGGKETKASEDAQSGPSPSPIMSLLANSPLSRFGQSITSDTASASKGEAGQDTGNRRGWTGSTSAGTLSESGATNEQQSLYQRQVTLSKVILIALIFFLFGSFLRSLQTPADYIIFPQGMVGNPEMDRDSARGWQVPRSLTPDEQQEVLARDFVTEIRRMLGHDTSQCADLPGGKPGSNLPNGMAVSQREIKKVLQVKYIFGGWDLIVALARD